MGDYDQHLRDGRIVEDYVPNRWEARGQAAGDMVREGRLEGDLAADDEPLRAVVLAWPVGTSMRGADSGISPECR